MPHAHVHVQVSAFLASAGLKVRAHESLPTAPKPAVMADRTSPAAAASSTAAASPSVPHAAIGPATSQASARARRVHARPPCPRARPPMSTCPCTRTSTCSCAHSPFAPPSTCAYAHVWPHVHDGRRLTAILLPALPRAAQTQPIPAVICSPVQLPVRGDGIDYR